MKLKKLVVLTGAGISAESGLATFRDSGGLWEGYKVEDVATPEAWYRNPGLVLEFYNERRKKALEAKPNRGHEILAELQNDFDVTVVTQNVDDLHERAGSSNVIHLHGSLFESRSTFDPSLVYKIKRWELSLGDKCEKGSQLRPNIVWFGEMVPMMETAAYVASWAPSHQTTQCLAGVANLFHICHQDLIPTLLFYKLKTGQMCFSIQINFHASE